MDELRMCRRCQTAKSTDDFYSRRGGGYVSWCKTCMQEYGKDTKRQAVNPWATRVTSEQAVIDELHRAGIWAQTGKSCSAPHVDVVARGCVWIEVKFSRRDPGRGVFTFTTTPAQAERGLLADLVVLVCEHDDGEWTFHVFPAEHDAFYMHPDNADKRRLKSGVTWQPGQTNRKHQNDRVLLTDRLMQSTRDHWELVDETQGIIEEHIRAGLPAHERGQ